MKLKDKLLVNKMLDADNKLDTVILKKILVLMIESIDNNILSGFEGRKVKVEIPSAKNNFQISHGLNFIPDFAIIVKQTPSTSTVTINYSLFTSKDIYITTTGKVSLEVLVGRLNE